MTTAQDEGKWGRMVEQEAERFMAKCITAEKARTGLRHAAVCPNVTGRTKERIAQSKRTRAGSFEMVDKPQVARTCILRVFDGSVVFLWCYVCFVFVSFSSFLFN